MIKREFDPKLEPVQKKSYKKVKMEKTTTTPTTKNPLTGEKLVKVNQQKRPQKSQWTKSYIMAVREVPQGHKNEFDPNAPKGSEEEVPVNQVSKIQIQEKL